MRQIDYLEVMRNWCATKVPELREAGLDVTIKASDFSYDNPSMSVYMEKADDAVFMIAWSSGEVQISLINYRWGDAPSEEYWQVETLEQFAELMESTARRFA